MQKGKGTILKSNESCISNPKSEIADWTALPSNGVATTDLAQKRGI
jgi:hypothetical protein